MNNKIIVILMAVNCFLWGCQEDVPDLMNPVAPTNVSVVIEVEEGRTGNVTFTPSADGALSFQVFFGDGQGPAQVLPGNSVTHRYTKSGQFTIDATVVAFGPGGLSSSIVMPVELDVALIIDPETLAKIAGNGEKRWVWQSNVAGHFGVGPTDTRTPDFFSADVNALPADCLYDDVMVFSHDGNNNYSYELITNGTTFINWAEVQGLFPEANPQQFVDECRDITGVLPTETSFIITTDEATGVQTLSVGGSFLSYFANISEFEVLELTDDILSVRGIQFPPDGGELAWYFTFVAEGAEPGDNGGNDDFELIWSDEFDTDGLPDPAIWTYDVGDGCPDLCGWGNNESQYYTDSDLDNARVEGGNLIIEVLKDDMGFDYTSARLKTEGLQEFTFGKVEVRAKLPGGDGTWSAIWMLGADPSIYGEWPNRGEIDIMEYVGREPGVVLGTKHSASGFAGQGDNAGNSIAVPDAEEAFHVYSVEWSAEKIDWFVDGVKFHTYQNEQTGFEQWPFDTPFFIILNIAMGGNLGGAIDDSIFDNPVTMEVDYVRVYQKQ